MSTDNSEWRDVAGWVELTADLDCMGRASQLRVGADCPFCGCWVAAYLWSLSGGGKRCHGCGAVLYRMRARRDPK